MTVPLSPDDQAAAKLVEQLDAEQIASAKHPPLDPVYGEIEAGNPPISHEELQRAMAEQADPVTTPEAER